MTTEDYARITAYSRELVAGGESARALIVLGHDGPPVIDRELQEVRMSRADYADLQNRMTAAGRWRP